MPIASQPNDYQRALDFLLGRINYERTTTVPYGTKEFKLDRMRRLMAQLGDPQLTVPAVHVAGTKGKGSTSAMIAGALTQAGHRTGLYTSPHLERLEERLVIDGQEIDPGELVRLVQLVRPAVEALDGAGQPPTYFEITTAMAFLHFARSGVEIAVLEVGLGGRLDSTNVCRPLVTLITSISFDHTRQLGNTLAAIAGEKAGIFKPGVPAISGVVPPEPRDVIRAKAAAVNAPLWTIGEDFEYDYLPASPGGESLSVAGPPRLNFRFHGAKGEKGSFQLENVQLGLLGRHQAANGALALAALIRLRELGWQLPEDAVRRGLALATCAARIEVVSQRPMIVVDAAHNVASVEALLEVLRESSPGGRRRLLFATTQEKDAAGMLSVLLPEFDEVVFTRYQNNPRGASPALLVEIAAEIAENCRTANRSCARWTIVEHSTAAWQQLHAASEPADLLCVTGSFFLAAEVRSLPLGDRLQQA